MNNGDAGRLVIDNVDILDPVGGVLQEGVCIVAEGGLIRDVVRAGSVPRASGLFVDALGLTVLPGLIDCHVHVTAVTANLSRLHEMPASYVAVCAEAIMAGMLRRGFTTVRDAGGADYGLARLVNEGLVQGPRLLFGGPALSQTGGHGDVRSPGDQATLDGFRFPSHAVVCDGADAVRRSARGVLRTGADHIKMMVSGGIASPTDRVESSQFTEDEIRAGVDEANAAGRYVMAHAYTADAIRHALSAGVRSIEHGNLLDADSLLLLKDRGAYLVPTLVTYRALASEGRELGLPAESYSKVGAVLDSGLAALEAAVGAGVQVAFGTDLLGGMHRRQAEEFAIRAEVQHAEDVIRSATTVAARLLGLQDSIGQVAPGFEADLIGVDQNPLGDLGVLADPEEHLKLIVRGGRVIKGVR